MTGEPEPAYWIWVFGEIEGLRWVLQHRHMAFPASSRTRATRIRPGDRAVLHVSRGAFHNPTRDVSRLAGIAEVTGPVHEVEPIEITGRQFTLTCPIDLLVVLPERHGPELKPLAASLSFVKRPEVWGHYFRVSPIRITSEDFNHLARAISLGSREARRGTGAGPA